MANTFKLKRSAVPGKIPSTNDLALGELALNTYDGKLFTKKNTGGSDSIVELSGGGGSGGIGLGELEAYNADGTQDNIPVGANSTLDSLTVNNSLVYGKEMDLYSGGLGNYGWKDLFGGMDPRGGATAPTWTVFRNGLWLYAFSATQMREVFASFHIDHDYALGTPLYPHMHYTVNTTSSGVVRWGFEYTAAKGHQQATGSVFGPTTTVYVNQTINGAADQYKHFVAEVSINNVIPATNIEPDTIILMRAFRDAGNAADTYPDAVFGLQTDMHYQTARFSTPNKAPDFYA